MTLRSLSRRAFAALTIVALTLAASATPQQEELGTIDFPTSASGQAQEHFVHGVLLMHSFEYNPSGEAFRAAQQADPEFAMAYWGEAMSYNHPIWQRQDRDAAIATLERLGPTPEARAAKAGSEKERDWLGAIEALYTGEGDKQARDFAYRDAMRRLHEKYPDDHEVAAFYALSLLGTSHDGRDFSIYMRSAAIVDQVFAENPDHPGAAHYLIHSFDDPVHAPLGLPAARAYSVIAPAASHAQHMTSHIFVAMGMWDDVVTANEVARGVADGQRAAAGQGPTGCGHYNSWLQYGYLQQGRIEAAEAEMSVCHEAMLANEGASGYFANMRARAVIDSQDWASADRWSAEVSGDGPQANYSFTSGLAAIKQGETDLARRYYRLLARIAMGENAPPYARILALELDALLRLADGQPDEALGKLEEATTLEENMPFEFGPPAVVKPSHELLAEVLLELEMFADAVVAFEEALARTPKRTASLVGLAHAADAAGDTQKADEARAALHEIWRHADDGYVDGHQQR